MLFLELFLQSRACLPAEKLSESDEIASATFSPYECSKQDIYDFREAEKYEEKIEYENDADVRKKQRKYFSFIFRKRKSIKKSAWFTRVGPRKVPHVNFKESESFRR